MRTPTWFIELNQVDSSYLVLLSLVALTLAVGSLVYFGLLSWVFCLLVVVVRWSTRKGFRLWEALLSWASWPLFLAVVFGFLVVGLLAGWLFPVLKIVCGLVPLFMGATACLAYMFIDQERYEVERGHKAVHNPLKGQELAIQLGRYGEQVGVPLLIAATVGLVVGFALFNQGLYETSGQKWYKVEGGQGAPFTSISWLTPSFTCFASWTCWIWSRRTTSCGPLTFTLPTGLPPSCCCCTRCSLPWCCCNRSWPRSDRANSWRKPSRTSGVRMRRSTSGAKSLPGYGTVAIEPLLASLRLRLHPHERATGPAAAAPGTDRPSTIPALARHLHDPRDHVRAIAVAALGRLHALEVLPLLVALGRDPSDMVRLCLVEALGVLGSTGLRSVSLKRGKTLRGRGIGWFFSWKKRLAPALLPDPVALAVRALRSALADESAAVRAQAALALGQIGPAATGPAPELVGLLKDADQTVRCQAAEALGKVGGEEEATVGALVELLQDASAPVKAAAARALGGLKQAAASAVPALVALLQDREEAVRTAATEAIAQAGFLDPAAIATLVEGLASKDNVVRARRPRPWGPLAQRRWGPHRLWSRR